MKLFGRERGDREVQADQHKAILKSTKPLEPSPVAAAPAGEGEAQLRQEREWDTHASMQGRRDLPQEVIDKHPSLSDPQQTSPASSAALPPLPPISGDMATSDRALTTGSTLEHTQQPLASLSGSGADSTSQLLDAPTTTSPTITTGSPSTGLQGPHSSDNMATSARAATETSSSSKSSSAYTSSVTTTTGRAGPPSLARVSISTISHEALDRTAPGDYHLVTHLGKECATCSTNQPAGHVSTHEQQQLLARASDLELEQRQHVDAAAEAARIAAAAAARAAELETEIRVEVTERRTLLLQQEETARLELSRLAARRQELMGRVGDLQTQLTALVEEEEGLLRQQLEAETARGELESRRISMAATVRDIESLRERLHGELGQAESMLAAQVTSVEEAEAAVQEALRRLQEAQARKADAESAVVSARGAVEAVLVQVGHVSQDREVRLTELQGIETELPTALQRLEGLCAEQHTLRARAEALQSEAARVKGEEEEAVERQERLQQESHSLSHLLSEVTARAHTLSCQAAAAAAKAAGARGLQAGEDARARAAAAEAEGLRAAAAALAEADATTTAALATITTTFTSSHISPVDTTTTTTTSTTGGTTTSSSITPSARDTAHLDAAHVGTARHGMMAEHAGLQEAGAPVSDISTGTGMSGMSGMSSMPGNTASAHGMSGMSGMTGMTGNTSADVSGGTFRSTSASEGVRGMPSAESTLEGATKSIQGSSADVSGGTFRGTSASEGVRGVPSAESEGAPKAIHGSSADVSGGTFRSTPAAAQGLSSREATTETEGLSGTPLPGQFHSVTAGTETVVLGSVAGGMLSGVTGADADIPSRTLHDTTVAPGPIETVMGGTSDSTVGSTVGGTAGGGKGVGKAGVTPAREVSGRSAHIPGGSMSSTPAAADVAGLEAGRSTAAHTAGTGGVMGAVASVISKPVEMSQSASKTLAGSAQQEAAADITTAEAAAAGGVTGAAADIPGHTLRDTTVAAGPIEAAPAATGAEMGSTPGGGMGVGEAGVTPAREVSGRSAHIPGGSISSTPAAADVVGFEAGHSTAARAAGTGGVMGAVASVISKPVEMIQSATKTLTGSTQQEGAADISTTEAAAGGMMPGVTGAAADIPGRTLRDTTVAPGPIETVMGGTSDSTVGSTVGSTAGGGMGVGEAGVTPAREVSGRSADFVGGMSSTSAAADVAASPSTSSASTSSSSSGVGVLGVREGYQGMPSPGGASGTAAATYNSSSRTPATRVLSQSEVTPLMSSSDTSAPVDDVTLGSTTLGSTAVGSTAAGSTLGQATDVMVGTGMRSLGEGVASEPGPVSGTRSGSGHVGGTRSVGSDVPAKRASGGGLLGAIRGMLAAGKSTYQEAAQEGESTATLPVGDLPIMTPATDTTHGTTGSTFAATDTTFDAPANNSFAAADTAPAATDTTFAATDSPHDATDAADTTLGATGSTLAATGTTIDATDATDTTFASADTTLGATGSTFASADTTLSATDAADTTFAPTDSTVGVTGSTFAPADTTLGATGSTLAATGTTRDTTDTTFASADSTVDATGSTFAPEDTTLGATSATDATVAPTDTTGGATDGTFAPADTSLAAADTTSYSPLPTSPGGPTPTSTTTTVTTPESITAADVHGVSPLLTGAGSGAEAVDRVPSRSIDISSSSSSSDAGSSPPASGRLPDSVLAGFAASAMGLSTGTAAEDSSTSHPTDSSAFPDSTVGGGLGGSASSSMPPHPAHDHVGVQEQHSNMQKLLQEEAEAPQHVPAAAAMRTTSPQASLEPLGSPVLGAGIEPATSGRGTVSAGVSSEAMSGFDASSIAAIAAEAADDAVNQQQQQQQQQQQELALNRSSDDDDDSAFHSPSNSAYHTPSSAMSLASISSRDPSNAAFFTPASAMSLASQSSRDTEAFAPVAPTPAALNNAQAAAPAAATSPFKASTTTSSSSSSSSSAGAETAAPAGTAAETGVTARTSAPLAASGPGDMSMSGAVGGAGGMGSEPVSTSTSRGDSMGQEGVLEGTAGQGMTVKCQSGPGGEGEGEGDGEGEGTAGGLGAVGGGLGGMGVAREGSARSSGSLKALGVAPAVWEGLSAGETVPPRAGSSSSGGRGPLAAGTGVTDATDVTATEGSDDLIGEGAELQTGTASSAAAAELDAADTQAAASAAQGVSGAGQGGSDAAAQSVADASQGVTAESAAGQGVYVGGAHLAAGLQSVPRGTSYEEAAREANALTDTVVAERKSEMTSQGEQKSEKSEISESSENFSVQLELPAKAFDSLSRPAGLVQGAPVSPHAHAAQQPGMAGAANTWSGSSHGVLQGGGATTVPTTSLSTASHTSINAPAGIRGSTGVTTGGADVSDVAPLRDSSSSISSSTGGGMDALESRPAAPKHPEPEADKPLGRRSYAEALAANLTAPDTPTVTPTTTTTTGPTANEPAAVDTPRSKQGVAPAAAPAGAAMPAAAAAEQSPRKRSFFGSLKKALGSGSSRNEA